ncbi:hypothetical protein [Marinobacter halotolerans]|uniref:hypothetical protein n=1 Tax=Marinobacter halotolerans TaxID=1569211 RepID=UPI001CDA0B2C|nr:hypothetical protein [Marinobacter halotolerans]
MLDKIPVAIKEFQRKEARAPREEGIMEKAQTAAKEIEASAKPNEQKPFLLSVGSLYRRKVIKISGPSFARIRKAARILENVDFTIPEKTTPVAK